MNVVYAFVLSAVITVLAGFLLLPVLRRLKFGQQVRDDGPASHLIKTGTPVMGGLMFLTGMAVSSLLLAGSRPDGLLVLFVTLGYGLIGFVDDYLKVVLKRPLGLKAREKLLGQVLLAVFLVILAVFTLQRGTSVVVPFSGLVTGHGVWIKLGFWPYLIFSVVVLVGASNGVNLTDGLDGLACGVTFWVALAFLLVAMMVDKTGVAVAMAALAGGMAGFMYFNRHPARVFMGDTGSMALGGALATAAILTRSELFLIIIGGIYVLETLSVIIQVISFQLTGRRVFRMAPLHHHFELGNWSEQKVVYTFWVLSLLFSLAGLAGFYAIGRI